MSPDQSIIQGLALALIGMGLVFWRFGPCGHEECRKTHARMVALDQEAEERRAHRLHVREYPDDMCRLCKQNDFADRQ